MKQTIKQYFFFYGLFWQRKSFGPLALNFSDSLLVLPHVVKKTKKRKKNP